MRFARQTFCFVLSIIAFVSAPDVAKAQSDGFLQDLLWSTDKPFSEMVFQGAVISRSRFDFEERDFSTRRQESVANLIDDEDFDFIRRIVLSHVYHWRRYCDSGGAFLFEPYGETLHEQCDYGDSLLFNGLLCASGEATFCDAVLASQDRNGRFWRSPKAASAQREGRSGASFSKDHALGASLGILAMSKMENLSQYRWRAKSAYRKWMSNIRSQRDQGTVELVSGPFRKLEEARERAEKEWKACDEVGAGNLFGGNVIKCVDAIGVTLDDWRLREIDDVLNRMSLAERDMLKIKDKILECIESKNWNMCTKSVEKFANRELSTILGAVFGRYCDDQIASQCVVTPFDGHRLWRIGQAIGVKVEDNPIDRLLGIPEMSDRAFDAASSLGIAENTGNKLHLDVINFWLFQMLDIDLEKSRKALQDKIWNDDSYKRDAFFLHVIGLPKNHGVDIAPLKKYVRIVKNADPESSESKKWYEEQIIAKWGLEHCSHWPDIDELIADWTLIDPNIDDEHYRVGKVAVGRDWIWRRSTKDFDLYRRLNSGGLDYLFIANILSGSQSTIDTDNRWESPARDIDALSAAVGNNRLPYVAIVYDEAPEAEIEKLRKAVYETGGFQEWKQVNDYAAKLRRAKPEGKFLLFERHVVKAFDPVGGPAGPSKAEVLYLEELVEANSPFQYYRTTRRWRADDVAEFGKSLSEHGYIVVFVR